jgi:hypothetical protein
MVPQLPAWALQQPTNAMSARTQNTGWSVFLREALWYRHREVPKNLDLYSLLADNRELVSFTASSQAVSAGVPLTLSWNVTGASYFVVSPEVGAVRGTSVSVTPSQSTMYTLYAMNAFGQATSTINITVR